MANQLRQQIDQISREKNINPEVIIAAIEDAILTASKKYYKSAEDLRSRFNNETGQIEVFAVRQIVETVETDAALLVHEQADEPPPGRSLELDVDELEAPAVRHPLGDGPDGFERLGLSQVSFPQKKEWGEPTLVQHPELEQ